MLRSYEAAYNYGQHQILPKLEHVYRQEKNQPILPEMVDPKTIIQTIKDSEKDVNAHFFKMWIKRRTTQNQNKKWKLQIMTKKIFCERESSLCNQWQRWNFHETKNRRSYCQRGFWYVTCCYDIPLSNVHLRGIRKLLPHISLWYGYWLTTDKLEETKRDCIKSVFSLYI